ncbi:MAG: thioredoxin family protein [Bergeyella zoohelcum]|nr:thioredoxin family protein [Bergeyella zoohelcum]
MKKLSLILVFISAFINAQVQWMSFNEAIEAQKKTPKKILVEVYATWCGPCKIMEHKTFGHPEISKYINENYYAVKFNGEGNESINYMGKTFGNPKYRPNISGRNAMHEFTQFLNITGYPTTIFFDEKAGFITNIVGAFSPKEIEPLLHFFATDEHKKIKSKEEWEQYEKKFKSKIKD